MCVALAAHVCSVSVLRCIVEPCDVLRLSGLIQLVYNDMVWALGRVVIVEKSPYPFLHDNTTHSDRIAAHRHT